MLDDRTIRAIISGVVDRMAIIEQQRRRDEHLFRALYMLMKAVGVPNEEREEWLAELMGDMKK